MFSLMVNNNLLFNQYIDKWEVTLQNDDIYLFYVRVCPTNSPIDGSENQQMFRLSKWKCAWK